METRHVFQPFDSDGKLSNIGQSLLHEINSGGYSDVAICVAFATLSGTSRLIEALTKVIAAGGKVKVLVGISNGVTTAQAVEQLLSAGVRVWGCETSVLYHPKIYLLSGDERSWASVGSSNLTANGLFRNFETNTITVFDRTHADDAKKEHNLRKSMKFLADTFGREIPYVVADLQALVDRGALLPEGQNSEPSGAGAGKATGTKNNHAVPVKLPPLPIPQPLGTSLITYKAKTKAKGAVAALPPAVAAAAATGTSSPIGTRHFAMTLSAFDCSHKTGIKGTPEVSLPEQAAGFFPPIGMNGRKFPDVYFDVRINVGAKVTPTTYRLWQRPPGSATGHADWRINIQHDTMDLTSNGGGDILLFEVSNDPLADFDVWVLKPTNPKYNQILQKCTNYTTASGAAGTKRWGLF